MYNITYPVISRPVSIYSRADITERCRITYWPWAILFRPGVVFHGRLNSVEQLHTWHRLLSICTGVFFLVSVFVLVSPAGFLVWDELIHIKSIKCSGFGWYRYMYSMNCLRCDLLSNNFTGSATVATWI